MSPRTALVIVLAVLCGSAAAVGISQLRAGVGHVEVRPDVVSVVVAKEKIGRGELIEAKKLTTRDYPKGLLPETVITEIKDCVGRTANVSIEADEPVLAGKLLSSEGGGLASLIPKGMRAYTIATSAEKSRVAGFVMPGNHVDVLLSLRGRDEQDRQSTGGGSTVTLLQAVEILAVAQQTEATTGERIASAKMNSVTLLVTPDQAAILDLAQNIGQLSLSLRNPDDTLDANPAPATLNMLHMLQLGPTTLAAESGEAIVRSRAKADEQYEIRTMRGRHRGYIMVHESPR